MRLILGFLIILAFTESQAQTLVGGKTSFACSRHRYLQKNYHEQYVIAFQPGYSVGFAAELGTKSSFSLITEFTYGRRGSKADDKSPAYVKNRVHHHLIELPILLKTTFKGTTFRPYLTFGPILQYRIASGGKIKADELDEMFVDQIKYNIKTTDQGQPFRDVLVDDLNNLLFGLGIGVGADIKLNEGQKYLVEFRFENGHTVISDSETATDLLVTFEDNYRASLKAFSLSVTYFFDLQSLRKSIQK